MDKEGRSTKVINGMVLRSYTWGTQALVAFVLLLFVYNYGR